MNPFGNGHNGHAGSYLFTERERELVMRRKQEADQAVQAFNATIMTIAELNQLSGQVQIMPSMAGLILQPPDAALRGESPANPALLRPERDPELKPESEQATQ